jgi:regulator of nonsense transcripts 2
MPELKQTASQQQTNIGLSSNTGSHGAGSEAVSSNQGPWEDEEERKFFEDITDLAEVVPKAILGISDTLSEEPASEQPAIENLGNPVDGLMEVLNAELEDLTMNGQVPKNGSKMEGSKATEMYVLQSSTNEISNGLSENHDAEGSRPQSPSPTTPPENSDAPAAGAGPSQLVAALLTRLLDATNRSLVDELAVEFAYLNSKAARKRLVKVQGVLIQ